jgi:predicted permease
MSLSQIRMPYDLGEVNPVRFLRIAHSSRDLGANLTIVLLLSFGLGTATLLYTALDRLLLHPLQGIQAETLVRAGVKIPQVTWHTFPFVTYDAVRKMRSFSGVAAESEFDTTLTAPGKVAERISGGMVSGNYFDLLGMPAEMGRILTSADEQLETGIIPVVLSHRFWIRHFGHSKDVIGAPIFLEGRPFTVVGVMPERFYGTAIDASPDLWMPLSAQPLLSTKTLRDPRPDRDFQIIGRLRYKVTRSQAESEFAATYRAQQGADKDKNPGQAILEPVALAAFALHDQFAHALSLLLWGLGAFLFILCANVAGLLLVRSARRERDTAVRIALGAGRTRVIARALLESVSLALAGAGGGLLAAYECAPLVVRMLPHGETPLPVSLAPDLRISALSVILALSISLVFGVVPAWFAARIAPQHSLRGGWAKRRTGASGRALLMLQTALTLVLLVAAGLLIRTFQALRGTRVGFDTEHLITFTLDASMAGITAPPPPTLSVDLEQRVRSLPGVKNASLANIALMRRIGLKSSVAHTGERIPSTSYLNTSLNIVSASFFDTMNIPILAGRGLLPSDSKTANPTPVVINPAFARLIFPHEDPIGKTFGQGAIGQIATAKYIVVGIAGDSKYRSLREVPPPIYYYTLDQRLNWDSTVYLYVRTQNSPASVVGAVRKTLAALDDRLPLFDTNTMHEQINESLWQERILATLAAVFSLTAVLMAATGFYGLMAFDANQRTKEFGIRAAVGASRRDMALLLVNDAAGIVLPGVIVGLVACLFLARIIASALYGIHAFDPISFVSALTLVAMVAVVSAWRPIVRSMGVDPAIVLREE